MRKIAKKIVEAVQIRKIATLVHEFLLYNATIIITCFNICVKLVLKYFYAQKTTGRH